MINVTIQETTNFLLHPSGRLRIDPLDGHPIRLGWNAGEPERIL